jgi:hypothetical protein
MQATNNSSDVPGAKKFTTAALNAKRNIGPRIKLTVQRRNKTAILKPKKRLHKHPQPQNLNLKIHSMVLMSLENLFIWDLETFLKSLRQLPKRMEKHMPSNKSKKPKSKESENKQTCLLKNTAYPN